MTSIERTAYPRFKRLLSARELHVFYTPDEVAWARGFAGSGEHLLAMVVMLTCSSRLGYFPALSEVPALIVDHVRRDLDLPPEVAAVYATDEVALTPDAYDAHLGLDLAATALLSGDTAGD